MRPTLLASLLLALCAASFGAGPAEQKLLAYCPKGNSAFLVGAVSGTRFTGADKLPRTRVGSMTAYTLSGTGTRTEAGPIREDGIGSMISTVTPPLSQEAFLVSGAAPRSATVSVGTADKALRVAILKLVQAKRPNATHMRVLQDLTVEMNGDGSKTELIAAESRANPANPEPEYTDADFTLAAMAHRSKEGISISVLHLDVNDTSGFLQEYRFLAAVDLTGQGHFEAILRSTYYEGQGLEIYDDLHHQPHRLLQTGWGL